MGNPFESLGLDLGFGSKKSKQTVDTSTTPIIPDWIQSPIADQLGRIGEIGHSDPQQFVAGKDPLQILAGDAAKGLGSSPLWDAAADITRGSYGGDGPSFASAASGVGDVPSYLNPYLKNVVDTSLADFDADAAMQRTQLGLGIAGRRSGSGADIATALLGGELSRARGSLDAGLRSQGWDRAAQLANDYAERKTQVDMFNAGQANNYQSGLNSQRLAAGGQLANIAGAQAADTRGAIGLQADIGGTFRDINSQVLNAPKSLVDWEVDKTSGLPLSMFAGEHQLGTTKTKENSFNISGKAGF